MQTLLFSASFQIGRQSSSAVEQRTHKPLVGSSNLPFGTILKKSTSRANERSFSAVWLVGIFETSNVTEAAQGAPASVILRCAADGRSARHLRAAALRLPFGTILKTLTSRESGRFFCAGINSEGIFEGSNVTEAAQGAPASVILRCAADGRSARHLRAVALRLPFGTILKKSTSRANERSFSAGMALLACELLRCGTHTRYHTDDRCKTTLPDGLQGRSPLPIMRHLQRRPAQNDPGIKPVTTQKTT
jgi:hypothetical protein